jgi:hypothetical protein
MGGVLFANFLDLLRDHQSVGARHFTPPQARMDVGDVLLAVNHGGETHTFTEVDKYGGGIVPMLNELSGMTTVAPECQALQPGDFIPAGGSLSETEEKAPRSISAASIRGCAPKCTSASTDTGAARPRGGSHQPMGRAFPYRARQRQRGDLSFDGMTLGT